jgi:hypothetical protein
MKETVANKERKRLKKKKKKITHKSIEPASV